MKKKRVLVTGASGFLGRNLVPTLISAGYAVETLGRTTAPFPRVPHTQVDLVRTIPLAPVKRADLIVHLASDVRIGASIEAPHEYLTNTLAITLNLLEACKQSGRTPLFVLLSTDRVYGKAKGVVDETAPVFPIEPYVAGKLMSETALTAYAHMLSLPYIILRASAFFGPHQPRRGFIIDVMLKMFEQDVITVGPLTGVKNFTYVGNVVDAISAALASKKSAHNRIYNIGGLPRSLKEVLEAMRTIVEHQEKKKIRVRTDRSIKIPTKHDIGPFTLQTSAARKTLGWREKTTLATGLAETIAYVRATLKNPKNK